MIAKATRKKPASAGFLLVQPAIVAMTLACLAE